MTPGQRGGQMCFIIVSGQFQQFGKGFRQFPKIEFPKYVDQKDRSLGHQTVNDMLYI